MNCKYCGAVLPTNGGHCPSCGRMIPVDQLKAMKETIDPKWNEYRNKDTAFYKKESNNGNEDAKIGKVIFIIFIIVLVIIILAILKGI